MTRCSAGGATSARAQIRIERDGGPGNRDYYHLGDLLPAVLQRCREKLGFAE